MYFFQFLFTFHGEVQEYNQYSFKAEIWATLNAIKRCRIDYKYIEYNQNDRRIRQGNPIFPNLFTRHDVLKTLQSSPLGINKNGKYLSTLRFGNDIAPLSSTI